MSMAISWAARRWWYPNSERSEAVVRAISPEAWPLDVRSYHNFLSPSRPMARWVLEVQRVHQLVGKTNFARVSAV